MKIIFKPYRDFPFQRADYAEGAKMIGDKRLKSVWAFEETEKNLLLASEHNNLLEQIEKLQQDCNKIVAQMENEIKS